MIKYVGEMEVKKKKLCTKCSTEALWWDIFISVWAKLGTGQ